MKLSVVLVYLFSHHIVNCIDVQERSTSRDGRKLFGGYKITPRYCKPTRETSKELDGPHICMFNHECTQRNGLVVGACMDGFLFGACCQLPSGSAGELMGSSSMQVKTPENELYTKAPTYLDDITFSAVSHITSTLLQSSAIPTAQEDAVVQVNEQDQFSKTGVTHPSAPETFVVNQESNDINPDEFRPTVEDRKTTLQYEETTQSYSGDTSPVLQISISNTPPYFTTSPGFKKPVFRPRPQKPSDADKYILVPTINHETKPNKTQEIDSIVNIIQMLNESSTSGYTGGTHVYSVTTTRRPPTSSLYFTATSTKRPGYYDKYKSTTKNPSTYINTTPPRKTTAKNKVSTTRATQKPSKSTSKRPTTTSQYLSSSTFRPTQSTYPSTLSSYYTSSKRPPSTSYVYSTTISKRPMTTTSTSSSGFTVTKNPSPSAPTLIVLGPIPNQYTTPKPSTYSVTSSPSKRPVPVTINNYFTQNIYSTSERPSPTVLITPKPSAATSYRPTTLYDSPTIEIETSADDLINFPPVRNPNLNMSISILEGDITTPDFVEDDVLNKKVESFVNKIIEGLQEPFQGLRDVVYNKNTTNFLETTTKSP